MTTIAMKLKGVRVLAACDLQYTSSSHKIEGGTKVWAADGLCWGWAGSAVLQRWAEDNPPPADPVDLPAWADRIRARAVEIGQCDGGMFPGEGLVGYAAPHMRFYVIGSDGAVIRLAADAYAIGSGANYALGAMAAGAHPHHAVIIASTYDADTGRSVASVEAGP